MDGWIKLHRKILENPISTKLELLGLLSYLLLNANYKKQTMYIGNQRIEIQEGQLVSSLDKMSKVLGLARTSLKRALNIFEKEQIMDIKTTTKYTVITIKNWDRYQQVGHQTDIKRTSNGHQTDITKKVKKEKKEKNLVTNVTSGNPLNDLILLFAPINPSFKRLYANRTERAALDRMISEHGLERVKQAISSLPLVVGKQFAPTITTPLELERKLGSLVAYLKRNQLGSYKHSVTKV